MTTPLSNVPDQGVGGGQWKTPRPAEARGGTGRKSPVRVCPAHQPL